uniref:No mechanoreceptor potential B n=1 Tax=Tetranychus urticae TaxID=32264 RepID=T1KM52_TETUR
MMSERIVIVPSLEDLYSGFNDFNPALDSKALQYDEDFQQTVLKSSYGRRGNTGYRTSGASRMGTAGYNRGTLLSSRRKSSASSINQQQQAPSTARPMTAVRGAGYTSYHKSPSGSAVFDPLSQSKSTSSSPFVSKDESSPQAKIKLLEKKVNDLLEESIEASYRGEYKLALDKAKQAITKEKSLSRQKEQLDSPLHPVASELTFAVLFNLGIQFTRNEMFSDAISTFTKLTKSSRTYVNSGRLKLNIGTILYRQGNYPEAIKLFRKALDQIPTDQRHTRMRVMRNIGLSSVKLNQYSDAITSFGYIMSEKGDFRDALHLIVCHYAIGDKENMKKAFLKLLETYDVNFSSDRYEMITDDDDTLATLILEAIKVDSLRKWERERKQERDWCILLASQLISPVIGETFTQGYEWCVDAIRSAGCGDIGDDIEINKAVKHLKRREFTEAIGTLKTFEKKEGKAASTAATNLSFLYLLQNELETADRYADIAIDTDRFNSSALVNKGNCCSKLGDYERASQFYKEALANESSCIEALYNLALANKKLTRFDVALNCLLKINSIIPNHPNVIYQVAHIYELMGNKDSAMDWFQLLITFVPSDPTILNRMSDIAAKEADQHSSFSYINDSYRYFPSHIPTIERLAGYYIETQVYEKAIRYLEKAAAVQPNQVKWYLLIAVCYRRSGNYQQALQCYKMIHRKFPDNIECVKFLVRICNDLGLPEYNEYSEKLKKMEKARESRERKSQSGRSQRSGSRASSTNRTSAESSRGDSASSNSSGYVTSVSMNSKNGSKKKSIFDLIENKGKYDDAFALDDDTLNGALQRPTTSWRKRNEDDEFTNDEIVDILPE